MSLEVLGEHPGAMRVGRFRNLIVVAWSGPTTGAAVRTLIDLMVPLHMGKSEVRSYVHMVPHAVALPDAEARAGLRYIMNRYEPFIACAGVLLEGSGFWVSAMRNVVIGLRLLTSTPFAYRIDTAVDDLLTWLPDEHYRRTGVRIAPNDVRTLLEQGSRWQLPRSQATTRVSIFKRAR
ncbi:MAG: hypothetical protein ABW352_14350 [Polyangiales bacterium]